MSVINTNVKSLVAQNAATVAGRSMSKAMEQLSTGKRINTAADDAAGLAISSRATSQIRGLDQAVRNANDGISMLQTAEGAMVEVTNMLQRMRELSVQSANDTNTADDRSYLDLEFQQLKAETDRIISNTQWNGVNVLDKTFTNNGTGTSAGKFVFQVGANANQTISHTIDVFNLGTPDGDTAGITADNDVQPGSAVSLQIGTLAIAGTYAAGDKITVNLNQSVFQYTITDNDAAGNSSNLATNLAAAMQLRFDDGYQVSMTAGGKVAITVDALNPSTTQQFTLSASSTDGEWNDIENLSILTLATSNTSVSTLDVALSSVNKARAEIGSVINRLTYAADNLTNVSQNAEASRSRILDTDYAKTTTELARTQIIQQAATAMLAQANQQPQSVLSLLR
jgi:flagellin